MVEVQDIIDKYKASSKSQTPTPIYLFIFTSDITGNLTFSQKRNLYKQNWKTLEYTEKAKYIEAAVRLGYVKRLNVSNVTGASGNLLARIKALREARALKNK